MWLLASFCIVLVSTVVMAEEVSFVDSAIIIEQQRLQLSLDHLGGANPSGPLIFKGNLQTVDKAGFTSRGLEVQVSRDAAVQVKQDKPAYYLEDLILFASQRDVKVANKTFVRHAMMEKDKNLFVTVTDDPNPIAVAAAIIAGGTVAVCGMKVIADIFKCKQSSNLEIKWENGFSCKVSPCAQ